MTGEVVSGVGGQVALGKPEWRRRIERRRGGGPLPTGDLFAFHLGALTQRLGARAVAAYYPFGTEPDLRPWLESLPEVLLPRLRDGDGTRLPAGSWGLRRTGDPWTPLRPAELGDVDLLVVPALAVDLSGTRLGRGGGWYDRALAGVASSTAIYAAVYSFEVFPAGSLPAESHDQPISGVVTEAGIFEL